MRLIFISFVLFNSLFAFSQNDTIYLQSDLTLSTKKYHDVYRLIEQTKDSTFIIRDFYKKNHILKSQGISESKDAKHYIGVVKEYRRDSSLKNIYYHKTYNSGWQEFYSLKSILQSKVWFEDGKKEGEAYFYNQKNEVIARGTFKDNKMYNGVFFSGGKELQTNFFLIYKKGERIGLKRFYSNNQLAVKASYNNNSNKLSKATFYYEDGNLIGTLNYTDTGIFKDGVLVEYFNKYNSKSLLIEGEIKIKKIIKYSNSLITETISYNQNGELIGQCTYKNNTPENGSDLDGSTLFTYKNGLRNGIVKRYNPIAKQVYYSYNLVEGQKEGNTTFLLPDTDSIVVGRFKAGLPYSGYILQKFNLSYYQNGTKNGIEIGYQSSESRARKAHTNNYFKKAYTANYKNDIKDGEFIDYTITELGPIVGTYKNNKKYKGSFIQKSYYLKIIAYYEEGQIKQVKKYDKNFELISIEDLEKEEIKYYYKGKKEGICQLKNGKPFEGIFKQLNRGDIVSILSYKEGKLNGKQKYFYPKTNQLSSIKNHLNGKLDGVMTTYNKKGIITSSGEYKNGEPLNGSFIIKRNKLLYKNGLLNGKSIINIDDFKCTQNYKKGLKDGDCICQTSSKYVYNNSQLDSFKLLKTKDSITLIGTYKNNIPFDGNILGSNTISQYKNGKKEGYTYNSNKLKESKAATLKKYKNDTIDGISTYYLGEFVLKSLYKKGHLINGPKIEGELSKSIKMDYFFYRNGILTDTTFEYRPYGHSIIKINGKTYTGISNKVNNGMTFDKYKDGHLLYSFISTKYDTLAYIFNDNDNGQMVDKSKNILADITYTNKYDSGNATLYNEDGTESKIQFRENILQQGCIENNFPSSFDFGNINYIQLCQNNDTLFCVKNYNISKIRLELTSLNNNIIVWPTNFNRDYLYLIELKLRGNKKEVYYDTETNLKLTELSTINGINKGIRIEHGKNKLNVTRYIDNKPNTYKLTKTQLITRIKEWALEK